jgi:transcriptional regulator with XRE-family HTH domain
MASARGSRRASRAIDLGNRVRELRRAQGLTQQQLADRVFMSAANLSRIETGDQGPPQDETIKGLAEALDVDEAELLRLAGLAIDVPSFEETVLAEIRALRTELRQGIERIEARLRH